MLPLDPEKWKAAEELFFGALEVPADQQLRWLRERCGNDSLLLSQVEAMLAADATAAGKIDGAVAAGAAVSESTSTAPSPPSQVGRRVGQYILVREIGRGTSSTLYEAGRTDGHHRRPVAIKLLARAAQDEAAVRSFRGERHVLTRLEHPNIVRLLDSGTTEDGRPYLITDYAQGIPVTRYCREAPIGETGKLAIFLSICEAIQHAHERKVLLRSLKPANILVSPEGKAKLVDFSAAVWMDPDIAPDTVPERTSAALSPEYASPELLRGEPATVRSDVYSLGAILFEMLTGRKVSAAHKESGPLAAIVGRAIQEDPARRYASMDEFAAAVRHYMKKGTSAPPVNWRLVAAAALGLVAVASAAFLWSRRTAQDTVDSVAVLPFVNLGTGSSEDSISDGLTEDIITALARQNDLKVPSRTTVWQYKGRVVDVRQVGRSLGVRAVLEGSVRRSGDNVRIAAQLIGVSDGFHLWAGSFDRKADRALELQREVAGLVAEGLRRRLAENGRRNPVGRTAPDGDAQRAFLEGYQSFHMDEIRNEWGAGGQSAKLTAAMQALERATKLDPGFSAGWAGLAETSEFAAVLDARNREAYRDRAEAAARKALDLEPTNALALTTLASVYANHDWNLKQAEPYLQRAVEASPHSTGITADYANLLASLGRVSEATELLESSQLLEPGSPRPSGRLAVLAAMRGDSAAARRYAAASLSRDPRNRHASWALGRADDLDGNLALAEQRYRQVLERYPTEDRTLASLGHLLVRAGRREEAMAIVRKLHAMVEQDRRRETFEALVRTALGEKNEALALIEQAWQKRDPNVLNLELEVRFRPLAGEPRFQAVARRLHGLR